MERWSDQKRRSGIITGKVFHIYDNLTNVWCTYLIVNKVYFTSFIHISAQFTKRSALNYVHYEWVAMNGLAWTLLWPCMCVLSVCRFPFISLIANGIREIIIVIICFADSGGWNIHNHALSWICSTPPPPPEIRPYGKRPPEGIPYDKPSPEEIPWQNFPRGGGTIPYGKVSPLW